jgi:hypothetical protein
MPDALQLTTLDTFRLTKDEIAQLETIRRVRDLPTLRAAMEHAIADKFREVLNEGVGMMSRPPARNGKPNGHHR